jgi:hypothetical protein
MAQAVEALGRRSQLGFISAHVIAGNATVASHGLQLANGGLVGGPIGGRATNASHSPQNGNGGRRRGLATGRPTGRRKDGKKKNPKRCVLCVKAGRVLECYSCKGRGGRAKCPHKG